MPHIEVCFSKTTNNIITGTRWDSFAMFSLESKNLLTFYFKILCARFHCMIERILMILEPLSMTSGCEINASFFFEFCDRFTDKVSWLRFLFSLSRPFSLSTIFPNKSWMLLNTQDRKCHNLLNFTSLLSLHFLRSPSLAKLFPNVFCSVDASSLRFVRLTLPFFH